MAVQTIATTVGTTAAVIIPPEAYAMPGSVGTTVSNIGANPIFIGAAGVTATTGVQVAAGTSLNLPTLNSVLYACTGTGTSLVVVGLFS